MLRLPPVIGHRGAAGLAPENTLAGFRKAAALGCAMVEFDVRLSADGVPVVFHDDRLERRTNGRGPVAAHRLEQLRRLDAGGGEPIPTLAEVLALCRALGLDVNIEIKPDPGAERATATAALAVARELWPPRRPPPLLSSFQDESLAAAAEMIPDWPRGLLVGAVPGDWAERTRRLGCAALHAAHRHLSAGRVATLRQAGLAVLAYTVNSPARARTLWNWGVAAVFSDRPDNMS